MKEEEVRHGSWVCGFFGCFQVALWIRIVSYQGEMALPRVSSLENHTSGQATAKLLYPNDASRSKALGKSSHPMQSKEQMAICENRKYFGN
jgi:hypothetical protein